MKIGVAGLGLIGGSLAKAYKRNEDNIVYGQDCDKKILEIAGLLGVIDGTLEKNSIAECDCIFLALYPHETIKYLESIAPWVSKDTVIIDCCGIKRDICKKCFELANRYGFTFVGGHPMAGVQQSGFKYSREDLFDGAYMIIIPQKCDDIRELERIKKYLDFLGFCNITVTTVEMHDKMIAFTSQLGYVISNAFIKSPTARMHKGFSAGTYKDMTRVAYLNEEMWTELFMENRDNLLDEINRFMNEMAKYKEALETANCTGLKDLLREGKNRKLEVDGVC